jgi:hypothetical protein
MSSQIENPDLTKYAHGENGAWIFLPRQCPDCKKIFTPDNDDQEKCEECMSNKPVDKMTEVELKINRLKGRLGYYRKTGDSEKVAQLENEIRVLLGEPVVPAPPLVPVATTITVSQRSNTPRDIIQSLQTSARAAMVGFSADQIVISQEKIVITGRNFNIDIGIINK